MVLKPENCYIVLYGSYRDKVIAVNKKWHRARERSQTRGSSQQFPPRHFRYRITERDSLFSLHMKENGSGENIHGFKDHKKKLKEPKFHWEFY